MQQDTRRRFTTTSDLTEAELDRARDQVRGAVAELAEFYDGDPTQASVRVCAHDCHLVVAWRWEAICPVCGASLQPEPGTRSRLTSINSGQPRCLDGINQHQCACGASVPPTERVHALYGEGFESWLAWWVAHYDGKLFADEVQELADDIIGGELEKLRQDCQREAEQDRAALRVSLLRKLNRAWVRLQAGADLEDVCDGDDYTPGVVTDDHGDLQAWADASDGMPALVELADMDLVGVPEVSRVTGLAPGTIKSHVHRGSLPAPEPVAGISALVWRRETIRQWALQRELAKDRPA